MLSGPGRKDTDPGGFLQHLGGDPELPSLQEPLQLLSSVSTLLPAYRLAVQKGVLVAVFEPQMNVNSRVLFWLSMGPVLGILIAACCCLLQNRVPLWDTTTTFLSILLPLNTESALFDHACQIEAS